MDARCKVVRPYRVAPQASAMAFSKVDMIILGTLSYAKLRSIFV